MPCIITDFVGQYDATNTFVPVGGKVVKASPSYTPFFVKSPSNYREVLVADRFATSDPTTGSYSITLPWPSEQDPTTSQWTITLPDGSSWRGVVPEGVAGPLSVHDLKLTYSWGLVVPSQKRPVLAIQGTPGAAGAAGAPGATGAAGIGEGGISFSVGPVAWPDAGLDLLPMFVDIPVTAKAAFGRFFICAAYVASPVTFAHSVETRMVTWDAQHRTDPGVPGSGWEISVQEVTTAQLSGAPLTPHGSFISQITLDVSNVGALHRFVLRLAQAGNTGTPLSVWVRGSYDIFP